MQADLKFRPWSAIADVGYWTTLAKKKLEQYKLSSEQKQLIGRYKLTTIPDKMATLSIDAFSFQQVAQEKMGPLQIKVKGTFLNTNTVEQFKEINIDEQENKLFNKQIGNVKQFIQGVTNTLNPSIKLLTFADLKKYLFSYYFLASAIAVKGYETLSIEFVKDKPQLNDPLNKAVKSDIVAAEKTPRLVVWRKAQGVSQYSLSNIKQFIAQANYEYLFGYMDALSDGSTTSIHTSSVLALFAILKSSYNLPPQRLSKITIFMIKDFIAYNLEKNYNFKNSIFWTLNLSKVEIDNETKLTQPRKLMELDLKSFMDERLLNINAVDLNIKLMKWRMLPRLDIQKIQSKKCLLFGAGTLGCQLARNLIGWGIKYIDFIDYSNVSYSNPVRQSLYEYEDSIKGGRPKAIVAAEKLKKIYPQIQSTGYHISVPMPGHFVTTEKHIQQTFKNLDLIEKLVSEHDVLFLLLDSRQARWLPTVLANKYDKACITVGLGFDSFLIVRHGVTPTIYDPVYHKERLSCYFCNDIATPQNTMKDRTLDQMCTVTRPGLSFASAAYASQLYISLIHHDLQHRVWADEDSNKLETTDLGKLPHHIRGSMGDFDINMFYGKAFEQCVACSKKVLDQYNSNRNQFMLSVFNNPQYIHVLTQMDKVLKQMELNTDDFIEIYDDSDEQTTQPPPEVSTEKTEQKN